MFFFYKRLVCGRWRIYNMTVPVGMIIFHIDTKSCYIQRVMNITYTILGTTEPLQVYYKINLDSICLCWHGSKLLQFEFFVLVTLTSWHADVLMCWHADMLMCWHVDVLKCWCADMLTCWHVDVLTCWYVYVDNLTCWYDVLKCWCQRLTCWHFDIL